MIGALDNPTSGKTLIDGRDIFSMKENKLTVYRRRKIGFIFQAFNLIPELTVVQNIIFPLLLDRRKPDKRYLEELLEVLNLKQRRNHLPSQLSGGDNDEVIALLKNASKRYAQTIIMITHNQNVAQTADRILQVSDGILTDLGRCGE